MAKVRSFREIIGSESTFTVLLSIVLALLVIFPLISEQPLAMRLLRLVFFASLTLTVYLLSPSRTLLKVVMTLGIVGQLLNWGTFGSHQAVVLISIGVDGLFMAVSVFFVIGLVAKQRDVTADTIFGGICGYLLIGLVWSSIFSIIEHLTPGAFVIDGVAVESTPGRRAIPQLTYFSFVTLTTLGYGDITPAGPLAAGLCALEAMSGQLYIAILIARVVGLHLSNRNQ